MNDFKTPVDSKQFAEAMYYFASSVHIIATDGEYGKRAVTISSCSPLSYDPPTLLVCLQKAKEANQIFLKNKSFTVNTINESYKEFADICGGRTGASQDDRFNNSYWKKSKFGTPILDKAHLSFECVLDSSQPPAPSILPRISCFSTIPLMTPSPCCCFKQEFSY